MRVATKLTLFSAFEPNRPPLRIRIAMVVQSGYDVRVGRRDFSPNHCIVSLICVDVVTDPTRRTLTSGRIPGTLICHVYPTWFSVLALYVRITEVNAPPTAASRYCTSVFTDLETTLPLSSIRLKPCGKKKSNSTVFVVAPAGHAAMVLVQSPYTSPLT